MRNRIAGLVIATVALMALPRVVATIGGDERSDIDNASTVAAPLTTVGVGTRSELTRQIEVFEGRLVGHDTYLDVRTLGTLYLSRATLTGDLDDYIRAKDLFTAAHKRDVDDPDAGTGLASAVLALHDFRTAERLAREVLSSSPEHLAARAVAADAALAVGDVERAAADVAQLIGLLPGDPSLAVRSAELAWVRGDVAASVGWATDAVALARSVGLRGDGLAYYLVYAAHRSLDGGDVVAARPLVEEAVLIAPLNAGAVVARGRLAAMEGDLTAAADSYREAALITPTPATLVALGDVLTAGGDEAGAADAYATVEAISGLEGVETAYRSTLARFFTDHGDPARGFELASAEWAVRRDVRTLALYGWALAGVGRLDDATAVFDEVIATGLRDPSILYQAAVVFQRSGHVARAGELVAAALQVSGMFDPIAAPAAAALLAEVSS